MSRTQRSLQLAAYADGEVAQAQRAAIEQELAKSPVALREVEDIRAQRAALHRVFIEASPTAELSERIQARIREDRQRASGRTWRIGLASAFAAAAVIMMSVRLIGPELWHQELVSPPPLVARALAVDAVLGAHRVCSTLSDGTAHDEFRVGQKSIVEANRILKALRAMPKEGAALPDLSESKYALSSACACALVSNCEVVHATYNSADGATLSVWMSDRPLALSGASKLRRVSGEGGRVYQVAEVAGGYSIVQWDERLASVVLCGEMPADQLLKIADRIQPFGSAARPTVGPRVAIVEMALLRRG